MSDEEFIGYCEIHSRTERALFSGTQIGRLLMLAGDPYGNAAKWSATPNTWRSVDLSDECKLARVSQEITS